MLFHHDALSPSAGPPTGRPIPRRWIGRVATGALVGATLVAMLAGAATPVAPVAAAPGARPAADRDHPVHPVHPGNPGGKGGDDRDDWDDRDDRDDRDDDGPQPPTPPTVRTVGQVVVAQANIPMRSGPRRFARGMRQLLASAPDFVTLNEQFGRSVETISTVAPGYSGFRVDAVPPGPGGREALGTVVLWRTAGWSLVAGGRIRLVDDDRSRFGGRIVVWDRYATWATLRSTASREVISVVSAHHMTNPAKYGPRKSVRQRAYRKGMNRLLRLGATLGAQGPVLYGGDFNVHAGQRQSWTATSRMASAGYQWYGSGVDYLFYPAARGVRLMTACKLTHRARVSDHPFLVGRFSLNATGQRRRAEPVC